MVENERTEALTDGKDIDELVKELDAILDAWFMSEIAPALDEASRARGLTPEIADRRVA